MYQIRAVPLVSDYLIQREAPLRVEIFKGSVDVSAECLRNTDAVLAIELIEHLYPDVLENLPFNIFGFMQPKLAIFSTPNSEFNVMFTPLENGFRHHDHKFEWSREQFKDWALNICERFPNYCVSIFGVGKVPPNCPDLGPVSQFALFVRKDIRNQPLAAELEELPSETSPDRQYEEVYTVDYPMRIDDRTLDQKIFDEASYYINQFRTSELYHNPEHLIYEIPFQRILDNIEEITNSADDLRRVLLANGHIISDDFVIVPEDEVRRIRRYWDDGDSSYDYDVDEDDYNYDADNPNEVPNGNHYEREEIVISDEECWD